MAKLRLSLDARCLNAYDQYHSFGYEKLKDLPLLINAGNYMSLTDLKSGYHQLKKDPSTYQYLGINFEGTVYHFAALPFGLSSACRAYTLSMKTVYSPLRMMGQRMIFLRSDAFFLFPSQQTAKFRTLIIVKLLTSLGFQPLAQKCTLLPTQQARFLGLTVDIPNSYLRYRKTS